MPIDSFLLDILVCPKTKQPLTLLSDQGVRRVNELITAGALSTREERQPVTTTIDGGLLTPDGALYPIREEIPIMLVTEAIDLSGVPDIR